jgi:hypothetical protein
MHRQLAQARLSEDAGEADQDNPEDSYVSLQQREIDIQSLSAGR